MSGVAGRSGRKAFVPNPAQRNMVRKLTGWGIPQQHICRVVTNPQTAKPLDPKSLRKHFALEIGTGAVEANLTVARLTLATILGWPPPPGTGAITNEWVRADLAIFWAKTRMGWSETGKPLDPKSSRKHFALDIGTDPVEANFLVGSLIYATIRGLPPPPGTVAITNKRLRGTKQRHPLPVGASSGKTVVRIRRLVAHRRKAPGPCQRLLALPVEH